MKIIVKENGILIIRADKNEEVFSILTTACLARNISSAFFSAIGAAGKLDLAYYDLATKEYKNRLIQEDMEIASLTGNITLLNGQLIIHAHGVFAKRDLSTIGGHVKKLVVSATCEIVLQTLEVRLDREKDEETGLNLLT